MKVILKSKKEQTFFNKQARFKSVELRSFCLMGKCSEQLVEDEIMYTS